MAPSWQGMVPPGMDDGSEFPAVSAYALPDTLVPPFLVPSAEPEAVENMVQEILALGIVPVNLTNDLAQALVFGIQSALAVGLPARRSVDSTLKDFISYGERRPAVRGYPFSISHLCSLTTRFPSRKIFSTVVANC